LSFRSASSNSPVVVLVKLEMRIRPTPGWTMMAWAMLWVGISSRMSVTSKLALSRGALNRDRDLGALFALQFAHRLLDGEADRVLSFDLGDDIAGLQARFRGGSSHRSGR
jgi:hypothetical protein